MATYKDIAQIFERNKNIGKRSCTFPGLVRTTNNNNNNNNNNNKP